MPPQYQSVIDSLQAAIEAVREEQFNSMTIHVAAAIHHARKLNQALASQHVPHPNGWRCLDDYPECERSAW